MFFVHFLTADHFKNMSGSTCFKSVGLMQQEGAGGFQSAGDRLHTSNVSVR